MRAFCGWLEIAGAGEDLAMQMIAADRSHVRMERRGGDGWGLALAEGPGAACLAQGTGGAVALVAGDLSSDVIQEQLEDRTEETRKPVTGLRGSYALVLLDPIARCVHLQVDRFAVHPLYYALADDGIVFGSSPRVVAAHPRVGRALSEQALFEYFYATAVPAPATVFRDVRALEPGTCLDFARGTLSLRTYWAPTFEEGGASRIGTPAEGEILALMRGAVTDAAGQASQPGAFLSGGIDSSTVVGCLRDTGSAAPRSFSIGFDVGHGDGDYDELHYARLVSRHFGAEHAEYSVTPGDILALLPRLSTAFGQPFGNASVVPTFYCARLAAEHGVSCLLGGDGGDELFGGNERYGRDWLFSHYARLPGPARRVLEAWAGAGSPLLGGLPVLRKAVSYVRHARVPLPDRLDVFNYVNVLGANRLFNEDFLSAVDTQAPLEARRALFADAKAGSDINRMLAMEFKTTLADNDLQKVSVMCGEAGVDVRFPFLADEVVDFSLGLPPADKVNRTQLRCFFRSAVTGYLPDEVIGKHKHGFGLPFGIWASQPGALRECVFDLLAKARQRGVIAAGLIDELDRGLLDREPRYYGPLVWMIIVLEGWLHENT